MYSTEEYSGVVKIGSTKCVKKRFQCVTGINRYSSLIKLHLVRVCNPRKWESHVKVHWGHRGWLIAGKIFSLHIDAAM